MSVIDLVEKLNNTHTLTSDEYRYLIEERTEGSAELLKDYAVRVRKVHYGNFVYIRGLIEISNRCKNNCYYCGIRNSNNNSKRYYLSPAEILDCAKIGYSLGFRTFVLQGGEDFYYNDDLLTGLIRDLKERYPECAVTLSLGERSYDSYKRLFDAGADRYLLRHETADRAHYMRMHPESMSFDHRMQCLFDLKKIGYQTGCGFMVGSPYQTPAELACDLKFIETFKPEMCGIGPFIPHHETPFANYPAGTLELTCYLLSIIRLIYPSILLPATTALGTIDPKGREKGILSGANVVMPNLSPVGVRAQYDLYDNKICTGDEAAECIRCLDRRMKAIGYEIVTDRGDYRPA